MLATGPLHQHMQVLLPVPTLRTHSPSTDAQPKPNDLLAVQTRTHAHIICDLSASTFAVPVVHPLSSPPSYSPQSAAPPGLRCVVVVCAGMLLGAGSFGRVFKGRWHGRDVAIKIIHCLPSELERVLREAEIMLHLDHPNCVRALNCIVHRKPQPNGAAMGGATHAGSGEPQSGQVCVHCVCVHLLVLWVI